MTAALLDDLATFGLPSGVGALHDVIDSLQDLGPVPQAGYDGLLTELDRAIRRLESVKLRVVAAANAARVAEQSGLADTGSWLARRTRSGSARAAADVHLATALDTNDAVPRPCADALASGELSTEHARVIVKATEQLPSGLSTEKKTAVEQDLGEQAQRLSPDQLRRTARRALAVVEDDQTVVDAHEDSLLRSEEDAALAKTKLTWHDNGDGTTSGHFTVPTLAAAILTRAIQSMTAPRRARLTSVEDHDWPHRSVLALIELLEHLPTDRLHGKVAATVVVTIDHTRLQNAVGAARLDIDEQISAGNLRRIACNAGILPAILDGPSLPLDLGRSSRLFTQTQRVALATRHHTCAADGCERPFAWCELHHREPWSHGGHTNLNDAIPLCAFHHRRIHDPAYRHHFTSDAITFSRRN